MGKDKNQKKPVSRKEARKLDRQQAKQAKNIKHQVKAEGAGPLQKILLAKKAQNEPKEPTSKPSSASSSSKKAPPPPKDPYIEAEELELARLSKLLGIDKKVPRKKAADKLNKEFDLFEGMGDGFGDFLMELDDLTDMVEGKSDRKAVFHGRDADKEDDRLGDKVSRSKQASKYGGHLIDEDEQEQSDIDEGMEMSGSDYDDEEGEEQSGSDYDEDGQDSEGEEGSDMDEMEDEDGDVEGEDYSEGSYEGSMSGSEEEGSGSEGDDAPSGDEPEGEGEGEGSGSEDEDMSESDDGSDGEEDGENGEGEDAQAQYTYRPAKGEDIYGRSVAAEGAAQGQPGKYVPPALRKAAALSQVNENSESVQALKRQLNGLMNKLSDQSKDSIVRAIKVLFDKNSVTVATLVLKDAIFAACAHPTQVMTTLIPIYAAIVAALHNSVGIDVGAVLVEHLATALVKSLAEATAAAKAGTAVGHKGDSQTASYIGTKLPANALLLLVYLYNLRVVHHTLIVDVMNALADHVPATSASSTGATQPAAGLGDFVELKVELLEHLINHCGTSIRSDDPVSLRAVIATLTKRLASAPADSDEAAGSSRLRFMSEALTDLKNNKSRRVQTANAEVVKKLRKWLGSIKAALGQKQAGDTCLRVTLQDLLNAETKGRWWRTGASWVGKQQADAEKEEQARKDAELARASTTARPKTAAEKTEEEKLTQLAAKMRMNTAARKNIFVVMMSSRDVTDAFERLSRLELKGKEDREVARVLAQCCAQERTYNAFYAELAKMLCAQHRQHKITFQFVFWDAFKAMEEAEDEDGEAAALAERRAVNLARLLAALVCSFHLPLTVIKPIDIATMSGNMVLFLSTLLLALFKEKISEEDYQNVLDRVATSRDFAIVRDNILFFLQKYLPSIPKGLPAEDAKKMSQRRKTAIRTFEAMSVLDISKGMMREDDL